MVLIVLAIALILTAMDFTELHRMRTRLCPVDPCSYWIPSYGVNALLWWAWLLCVLRPHANAVSVCLMIAGTTLLSSRDALRIYRLIRAYQRGDHDDDDHPPRRRLVWRLRLNQRTGLPESA